MRLINAKKVLLNPIYLKGRVSDNDLYNEIKEVLVR